MSSERINQSHERNGSTVKDCQKDKLNVKDYW